MPALLNFGLLFSQTTAFFSSNRVTILLGGPVTSLLNFGNSGNAASKTEAIYFPPPRMAYEAADTSRFYIDGTGFIDFCEKFKYLGSMPHHSLTSDADVDKRITSATAAFGALKDIFADKYLSEELKGEVYKALILPTTYFTVAKLGPCVKIYLSAFEVSLTGVLVACAV